MRLFQNAKESDQARIAYTIVPSEARDQTFQLMRMEIPWLEEGREVPGKGFPLAEGLLQFQLEYYDDRKEEWVREWDTEKIDWKDRLPSAVRISLLFPDPDAEGETLHFTTAVFLPLSRGALAF